MFGLGSRGLGGMWSTVPKIFLAAAFLVRNSYFCWPAAPWSRADVIPRHGGGGNTESALWFCRAQGGQLNQMPAPVSNALSVVKNKNF